MKRSILFFFFIILCSPFTVSAQTTTPILTINTEMHTVMIRRISADASGRLILTCSKDKTAKLWDGRTGNLIKTFHIPIDQGKEGMLFACAISPDGKTVAVGGYTSKDGLNNNLYIFNTASNTLKHRITGLPNTIQDIEFSSDGNFMVATLKDEGIRIFETTTWSLEKSLTNNGSTYYKASFDNTGRLAIVGDKGKIRLYSNTFELLKEIEAKAGKEPFSLAFSPDGALLAVAYLDVPKIQVFDGKTLKLLYEPDITGANTKADQLFVVSFSYDGHYLIAAGAYAKKIYNLWWREIRVWTNKGKGSYTDHSACMNSIMSIKPLPDNSFIYCGSNPDFGRMKIDGTEIFYKPSETNPYNDDDKTQLRINNTGSVIGVKPWSKLPLTFSVIDRSLKVARYSEGTSCTNSYAGLIITDWYDGKPPKINSKEVDFLHKTGSYSVDISKDAKKIVFGSSSNIYCTDAGGTKLWDAPVQGIPWSVNISDNDKVVVASLADGTIGWYSMEDGTLLFSLFLHPDNKRWVLWSPKGAFDCSQGADNLIGWHVNQGPDKEALYYPASQFFEKFYTPNLGARILSGEEITGSDLSLTGFKLPPLVKITSPNANIRGFKPINNVIESEQEFIDVTVEVTDQGGGIDEILLYHNDKLVETTNRGFKPVEQKNDRSSKTFTITLTNGENKIKATAFNKQRTEAIADQLIINYAGTQASKSDLYLFVIGINEYKNTKYNLNYAVADAQGFKQEIEQGSRGIFNSIKAVFLTNSEATKPRIINEISNIKSLAKQDDIFIFYYAGHGVMSEEQEPQFYIIPHDVTQLYGNDQILKSNGISANELKVFSTEIKAQKQLYILDACQSGGMVGMLAKRGAAEEKAVNQLARSTGTYWFAASGSEQFAGEFTQLGHGLFTYCILQGLSGKADGQNDKKITVQELSSYLNDQVPLFSKQYKGGSQYPNTYGYGNDFPIIIVK